MAIKKISYEEDEPQISRKRPTGNINALRLSAIAIIEGRIENSQREDLGGINNLMINLRTGEIEYVVVEFGSFLGMGGKLFAIPFSELRFNPDKRVFTINRDREYLKQCPGFDKDHWPDTNDHSYFKDVSMYWGSYTAPYP